MIYPALDAVFPKSIWPKTTPMLTGRQHPQLIENHPQFPASDAFVRKVDRELSRWDPSLLGFLKRRGVRIKTGRLLVEMYPDLGRLKPRGWDAGRTWFNASGAAGPKYAVCSQYYWETYEPQLKVAVPMPADNPQVVIDNAGKLESLACPEREDIVLVQIIEPGPILRHEAGHVFDTACAGSCGKDFSETWAFKAVYRHDLSRIKDADKLTWEYFIQPTPAAKPSKAGASEAFAESFAYHHGGGCIQKKHFRWAFPGCLAFMKDLLARIQQNPKVQANRLLKSMDGFDRR